MWTVKLPAPKKKDPKATGLLQHACPSPAHLISTGQSGKLVVRAALFGGGEERCGSILYTDHMGFLRKIILQSRKYPSRVPQWACIPDTILWIPPSPIDGHTSQHGNPAGVPSSEHWRTGKIINKPKGQKHEVLTRLSLMWTAGASIRSYH